MNFRRCMFKPRVFYYPFCSRSYFHRIAVPENSPYGIKRNIVSFKRQSYMLINGAQYVTAVQPKEKLLKRIKWRLSKILVSDKLRIKKSAGIVYQNVCDGINYEEFFSYFHLPDTFQSWFLVMELHVWMCILITSSERHRLIFRNAVVDNMWNDTEERMLKVEGFRRSDKKEHLAQLYDQFQAALIGYDEGILSEDIVLAATIWRRLYSMKYAEPELLEKMTLYIRKQVSHLDSLNTENILYHGTLSLLPINVIMNDISDL